MNTTFTLSGEQKYHSTEHVTLDHLAETSILVILLGGLLTTSLCMKGWFSRVGLPPMMAYLLIGFLVRAVNDSFEILPASVPTTLEGLAHIGIICLLFKVGMEANLPGLLAQLRSASMIWICNIIVSGGLGFAASYWVLGIDLVPSLVVAVALTATSVGIPVEIWRNSGALSTGNGQRFLDVAELDDISAVILIALLFSVMGDLRQGADNGIIAQKLGWSLLHFMLKFSLFVVLCYVFARYIEKPLTARIQRLKPSPDPMLSLAGVGFVITGCAGLLGFPLAVGAFFSGLAFSRDSNAVRIEDSFGSIYDLFTPFFFIHIGSLISTSAVVDGLWVGAVLFPAAVLGKILGTVFPARVGSNWLDAWTLSFSMVPRSEIALLVTQSALLVHGGALPEEVFSGMVLVCAATCVFVPPLLQTLLKGHGKASGAS